MPKQVKDDTIIEFWEHAAADWQERSFRMKNNKKYERAAELNILSLKATSQVWFLEKKKLQPNKKKLVRVGTHGRLVHRPSLK